MSNQTDRLRTLALEFVRHREKTGERMGHPAFSQRRYSSATGFSTRFTGSIISAGIPMRAGLL